MDFEPELQDEWFGEELVKNVQSYQDLLGDMWQRFLWLWAWTIITSVAVCEFVHGRSNAVRHANMKWSAFAAAVLLKESRLRVKSMQAVLQIE